MKLRCPVARRKKGRILFWLVDFKGNPSPPNKKEEEEAKSTNSNWEKPSEVSLDLLDLAGPQRGHSPPQAREEARRLLRTSETRQKPPKPRLGARLSIGAQGHVMWVWVKIKTGIGPQVLVHASIYHGSILGNYFDPQPCQVFVWGTYRVSMTLKKHGW